MDADSSLYPVAVRNLTARIVNGKFAFEGVIPNPMGYTLMVNQKYRSDLIIVDPGLQTVECKVDSSKLTLTVDNTSMSYHPGYLQMFEQIAEKRRLFKVKEQRIAAQYNKMVPDRVKTALNDELKSLYEESDRTLVNFIQSNADSYLGFWKLADLLKWGFEPTFRDAPGYFSDSVKRSFSGKAFMKLFMRSRALSKGEEFPFMDLLDMNETRVTTKEFARNKYTLIDFWYSSCSPCIGQFPDLKNLYVKNAEKGFNIIGISTDGRKYKNDWLLAIKKYGLDWTHYWDVNGKTASELSIHAFPTNFLIDRNGVILQKNISMTDLAAFLRSNL